MKQALYSVCQMCRIAMVLLPLLLVDTSCTAQPDSLLQLKGGQHMDQLWHWYHHNLPLDSTIFLAQLDKLESTYRKKNQKELAQQAWFFKTYYLGVDLYRGTSKSMDFFSPGHPGGEGIRLAIYSWIALYNTRADAHRKPTRGLIIEYFLKRQLKFPSIR